jgi:hypothetical protein
MASPTATAVSAGGVKGDAAGAEVGVGVAVAVGVGEGVGVGVSVGGGVAGAAGMVAEARSCCQSLILPAALTVRMV